jgi:hypothetical protein
MERPKDWKGPPQKTGRKLNSSGIERSIQYISTIKSDLQNTSVNRRVQKAASGVSAEIFDWKGIQSSTILRSRFLSELRTRKVQSGTAAWRLEKIARAPYNRKSKIEMDVKFSIWATIDINPTFCPWHYTRLSQFWLHVEPSLVSITWLSEKRHLWRLCPGPLLSLHWAEWSEKWRFSHYSCQTNTEKSRVYVACFMCTFVCHLIIR